MQTCTSFRFLIKRPTSIMKLLQNEIHVKSLMTFKVVANNKEKENILETQLRRIEVRKSIKDISQNLPWSTSNVMELKWSTRFKIISNVPIHNKAWNNLREHWSQLQMAETHNKWPSNHFHIQRPRQLQWSNYDRDMIAESITCLKGLTFTLEIIKEIIQIVLYDQRRREYNQSKSCHIQCLTWRRWWTMHENEGYPEITILNNQHPHFD